MSEIIVTTADDVVDASDTVLSLREAITLANENPDADTITFDTSLTGETVTLSGTELTLTSDITIDGDIDGDNVADITIDGDNQSRVFNISSGGIATLDALTITGGNTTASGGGINIVSGGTATVTNSTLSGNSASRYGGGIYNNGTAEVTNSTLSGNTANTGGGISNYGNVTVTNSTLSGNSAANTGGGIENYQGNVTVTNSTLSGNSAVNFGGGIYNYGNVTVTNSTLSGNTANYGGGIYDLGTATVTNSIVLGNNAVVNDEISGTVTNPSGLSIIGGVNAADVFAATTDGAGVLADNGGPVQTIALKNDASNPALDAGDDAAATAAGAETDAAGFGRTDYVGAANNGTNISDLGALELQTEEDSLIVTTEIDVVDAYDGETSLREAVAFANSNADASTITFASSLDVRTVTLSGTELTLTSDITIDGDIDGDNVADITIDGDNQSRVFNISSGGIATLDALTITGGNTTSIGGGINIENGGTATVTNSTLSGNTAGYYGGGIYNRGTATVTNSTLSGNTANYGGGIINNGTATVTNSTLSGNTANFGGGIYNYGNVTVTNSTLSGNTANYGGGIYDLGTATVTNSIVLGNNAVVDDEISGTVTNPSGLSIIGGVNAADVFAATTDGAGVLADNGGPVQTIALKNDASNPALDAGDDAAATEADAGGFGRTDYVGVANNEANISDLGALELQGANIVSGNSFDMSNHSAFYNLTLSGSGNNYGYGNDNNNTIVGNSGSNTIKTYGGNDKVYGGQGTDTVELGDGNDYVRVGGGAESFDGGAGKDYISYYDSTGGVNINLATDAVSGSWASNDTISGFESASGSRVGGDVIYGTAGSNTIKTYGGNDKVYGGQGTDTVELGDGNDYVRVGGGAESFDGGAGKDYISYYDSTGGVNINLATDAVSGSWASNDTISGFESASGSRMGGDVIYGTAGSNTIKTYGGNDKVYGGQGTDTVELGDGNDYVRVGGGAESFDGGAGKDYISYYDSTGGVNINLATDAVSGSWASNDTISGFESASGSRMGGDVIYGTAGSNTIKTYGGNDKVYGGKGTDTVELGDGNDYVRVGGGAESFDGGAGKDYISYYDSTGGVNINLATDAVSGSWASNDTISGFESASGSRMGGDVIYGTAGSNTIKTYGGNDKVYGGQGTDTVELGDGNDYVRVGGGAESFDGGAGKDYISYYDSTGGVNINLATDAVSGSWASNDTISGFESASGSRMGGDVIYGTAGSNTIKTYGGNDKVYGGKGTDTVELGDGNDYVRVGGGAESFDGGAGKDYISYYDSTGGVNINLATDAVSGSWASNDTISGFESASGSRMGGDVIYGTAGSNTIKTYGGNDKVYGGQGTDTVELGDGNDYVRVGGGAESFDGGAGKDYISYYDSTGGVNINLATDAVSGSWASNDTISGFESASGSRVGGDVIYGTAGSNTIKTYGGNDKVYGGAGNDKIEGGSGKDSIEGGSGQDYMYAGNDSDRDVFIFRDIDDTVTGSQRDHIYQFDSGEDDIDLSFIDANEALSGDQSFTFSSNGAAANSVWTQDSGSNVLVRGDVNGDTIHDFEIYVASVDDLYAYDFIL